MRCYLLRDTIIHIFKRIARSTGNEYWSNDDLSPHFYKINEEWVHCGNRYELEQFKKHGVGYTIFKEYKDKELLK